MYCFMKRVLTSISFVFCAINVFSATITSNGSGDWDAGTTWVGGVVPTDGDNIIIAAGHTVEIDGSPSITLDNVNITINGTLDMDNDGCCTVGTLNLTGTSGILISATGTITESVGAFQEGSSNITLNGDVIWSGCSNAICLAVVNGIEDPDPELSAITSETAGFGPLLLPLNNNPLPVEFLFFSASHNKGDVLLQWATATEETNSHFEIERSTDLVNFEMIDWVEGAGDSKERIDYEFIDYEVQNLKAENIYYRLKQVDYDGKFEYSRTMVARKEGFVPAELTIWPNPFISSVTLSIIADRDQDVNIVIYDLNGREMYAEKRFIYKGNNDVSLERMESIRAGTHLITLRGSTIYQNQRLVKAQ